MKCVNLDGKQKSFGKPVKIEDEGRHGTIK